MKIDIGCAGGIDVTATAEYDEEETEGSRVYNYRKGIKWWAFRMDIHKDWVMLI
jgi:dipeptidase D